jgi:hypothetical protein
MGYFYSIWNSVLMRTFAQSARKIDQQEKRTAQLENRAVRF